MIYSIDSDVPESWDSIITAFITMTEYAMEFHQTPEVYNLSFSLKRGLLDIRYHGGDKRIDHYAELAKELSSLTCACCTEKATRYAFNSPRCDLCT